MAFFWSRRAGPDRRLPPRAGERQPAILQGVRRMRGAGDLFCRRPLL